MADRYIPLVSVAWDSGTEYYSFAGTALPLQFYSDRLISIDRLVREVGLLPGRYRVADAAIELANHDNHFGAKRGQESFRNRTVTISIVNARTGESAVTLWTAVISDWEFSEYKLRLGLKDESWARLYGKVPALIFNETNFPSIPGEIERAAVPHAFGELSAYGLSQKGAIKATLVTSSNPFQYVLAQHSIYDVLRVYRYGALKTEGVDYTVTTAAFNGIYYDVIQFTSDQRDSSRPNETEITTDIQGYASGTFKTAPIEQLMLWLYFWSFETVSSFPSIEPSISTHTKLSNKGMQGAFYIDDVEFRGVDLLDAYAESFNLYPYRNKAGKLVIYKYDLIDEIDATAAADLSDENDLVRESLSIIPYESPMSQLQTNHSFNWVPEKYYFEKQPRPSDGIAEDEIIQPTAENVDLWAVRSDSTAAFIRAERRYLASEGTHLVRFELPFEHYSLDLNDWISLTSRQGIGESGFSAKKMRIICLEHNLDLGSMGVVATCVALPEIRLPDIGGCKLALDAKHIFANLWSGVDGALETWPDPGELHCDVTQGNASYQPVFDSDGAPNELPAVVFTTDLLSKQYNVLGSDTKLAFFCVFKTTSVSGTQHIYNQGQAGSPIIALYIVNDQLRFTVNSTTNYAYGTIAADTWYYVSALHDDAGSPKTKIYINGELQANTASVNRSSTASTNTVYVGGTSLGNLPFQGSLAVAGMICRPIAILDAERRAVEDMLKRRYSL
jgi:hypothetical protein